MIIGITGSLATGKSTVAKLLARKGSYVLDADRISHAALRKGTETYKKIVYKFGKTILNKNKSISKKKLAHIVFKNKKNLKKLTSIIHPFVIRKIKDGIRNYGKKGIVIIDAPLLIEAGINKMLDTLIVVRASKEKQLSRAVKNRRLTREQALLRIKNQMSLSKKVGMADYVVNNNGTLKETKKRVNKIWRELRWI